MNLSEETNIMKTPKKFVGCSNRIQLNGESPEFTWIEQHAAVIEQFTKMMGYLPEKPKDFYNQYDIAMYENARWTEEKFGKSIVWAHNGHTAKTNLLPQVYDEIAGRHLAKHYGPKYVSIGTSVATGQYQAEDETTKPSFCFQLMRTTRKA